MQLKKKQQTYRITLTYANGMTRLVTAKGSTREVAEDRALKHNPNATGVKR